MRVRWELIQLPSTTYRNILQSRTLCKDIFLHPALKNFKKVFMLLLITYQLLISNRPFMITCLLTFSSSAQTRRFQWCHFAWRDPGQYACGKSGCTMMCPGWVRKPKPSTTETVNDWLSDPVALRTAWIQTSSGVIPLSKRLQTDMDNWTDINTQICAEIFSS